MHKIGLFIWEIGALLGHRVFHPPHNTQHTSLPPLHRGPAAGERERLAGEICSAQTSERLQRFPWKWARLIHPGVNTRRFTGPRAAITPGLLKWNGTKIIIISRLVCLYIVRGQMAARLIVMAARYKTISERCDERPAQINGVVRVCNRFLVRPVITVLTDTPQSCRSP